MLDHDTAQDIYTQVMDAEPDTDLLRSLMRDAIRYAGIRANWTLLSVGERMDADAMRTRAHDAFIASCNILSRDMHRRGLPTIWRQKLGDDRKVLGDFACWLACFAGLRARQPANLRRPIED